MGKIAVKMLEITELNRSEYQGKPFSAPYRTKGYFDIEKAEGIFRFVYKPFNAEREKSIDDTFFGEWLDSPTAYGAFEDGELIGYVEGSLETWNNRYRISNICIFDSASRKKGIGKQLMQKILEDAQQSGARMVVLETQTCNITAISFYQSFGFEIIGFDLFAYGNDDLEKHEVRIEMGKMLL